MTSHTACNTCALVTLPPGKGARARSQKERLFRATLVQAARPQASGLLRNPPMPAFVTLKIGETRSGNTKKLHALRSTANYYGWTEYFEEWSLKTEFIQGSRQFGFDPGRRGHPQCSPGRRLRICRSPSKSGLPAGFTNAFKVTSNVGLLDLAELAHFTKVDWEWMEDTSYARVSRDRWEDRYARATHR